ncbi:sensor histidine kinase [Lentzea flava]|uniref:sensor histidine kinase n=1 Tax=Lentzea flava TaxID=103732 RepID=UPI0034D575CC
MCTTCQAAGCPRVRTATAPPASWRSSTAVHAWTAVLADQLFEPFRRLCFDRADPPPGNGLGLSVVRAIAEAHDGSATARPRPEGGLVVRVVLPAAAAGGCWIV